MMSEPGKSRVLIVDDQSAIREELAYALQYEGYQTVEAADGATGLVEVEKGGIDAVLLDIKMPGMDGLEVLGKLRESNPEIPVIMITGASSGVCNSARNLRRLLSSSAAGAKCAGSTPLPMASITPPRQRP